MARPLFTISISTGSRTAIFQQIIDQVRLGVARGLLLEGDPLPSVRALGEQLVINPNTVARAYNQLVSDGVVDSRPGRGFFVARARQIFNRHERLRRLEPLAEALVQQAVALQCSPGEVESVVKGTLSRLGLDEDGKVDKHG
jgi:GntR family transcriptional regulator